MANDTNFITATELIRAWFQGEAIEFKGMQEDLMSTVGEWVLTAYVQGHAEGLGRGLEQGLEDGYDDGHDEGKKEGYDEGYEDAKAEYELDD